MSTFHVDVELVHEGSKERPPMFRVNIMQASQPHVVLALSKEQLERLAVIFDNTAKSGNSDHQCFIRCAELVVLYRE